MPDLRQTLNRFLAKWGTNVYLQRRLYSGGQGIYAAQIPDPKGMRFWSPNLERYTVSTTFAGRRISLSETVQERPEGFVHTIPTLFYFPWYAHPKEGDRIYLKDSRLPNELGTYLVSYSYPETGRNGDIVFYTVGSVREHPS